MTVRGGGRKSGRVRRGGGKSSADRGRRVSGCSHYYENDLGSPVKKSVSSTTREDDGGRLALEKVEAVEIQCETRDERNSFPTRSRGGGVVVRGGAEEE